MTAVYHGSPATHLGHQGVTNIQALPDQPLRHYARRAKIARNMCTVAKKTLAQPGVKPGPIACEGEADRDDLHGAHHVEHQDYRHDDGEVVIHLILYAQREQAKEKENRHWPLEYVKADECIAKKKRCQLQPVSHCRQQKHVGRQCKDETKAEQNN